MSKSLPHKIGSAKEPFWNGVFTGAFIVGFLMSLAIIFFIKFQGFQVAINPEQLAKLVQIKVQSELRSEIPQIFEDIKKNLPNEISNHLEELDGLTIGFGNSQVKPLRKS